MKQMESFQIALNPLLFPEPPSVPPSSELFSASETNNLIGFLDNFTDWDFSGDVSVFDGNAAPHLPAPPNFHSDGSDQHTLIQQAQHGQSQPVRDAFMGGAFPDHMLPPPRPGTSSSASYSPEISSGRAHPYAQSYRDRSSSTTSQSGHAVQRSRRPSSTSSTTTTPTSAAPRPNRPLLDDKQKRMNHIMSEQKRRNAIRDGYAQLTTLLAPAGAPPGTGMPTRGRPKGSGTKGKSRPGAGKSGVLLRAVEYCRWLEEGRDALFAEVQRLEAAAGIRVDL